MADGRSAIRRPLTSELPVIRQQMRCRPVNGSMKIANALSQRTGTRRSCRFFEIFTRTGTQWLILKLQWQLFRGFGKPSSVRPGPSAPLRLHRRGVCLGQSVFTGDLRRRQQRFLGIANVFERIGIKENSVSQLPDLKGAGIFFYAKVFRRIDRRRLQTLQWSESETSEGLQFVVKTKPDRKS